MLEDEGRRERKELARWFRWALGLTVLAVIVFAVLRGAGVIGQTVLEREVFEQSYQRTEGIKQQISTFEAEQARIRGLMQNPELSQAERANLQGQLNAIDVQLRAARARQ